VTGIVKLFDPRGYGFIRPSDGSEDLYFHCSELPGERGKRYIDQGTYVEYQLGTRNGKKVARDIRILGGAE
jgi:cold shock CspA family protein